MAGPDLSRPRLLIPTLAKSKHSCDVANANRIFHSPACQRQGHQSQPGGDTTDLGQFCRQLQNTTDIIS